MDASSRTAAGSASTGASARFPQSRTPPAAHNGWVRVWAPVVIGVVAFCCRLFPVLNGGGLFGRDTYDPGVHYAAAVGMASGLLPYRDFLFLQPPGMLLVLQPFAWLGALAGDPVGLATARVAFMAMGAANAVLVYRILVRHTPAGAAAAAGLWACWFPTFYTERNLRLEAVANLLVLVGILLVVRALSRSAVIGSLTAVAVGAVFGLGAVVKIWGLVPLAVLLGWLLLRQGIRAAAAAGAGAVGAITVVLAPFALATTMWFDLALSAQLGRPRVAGSLLRRGADILGLAPMPRPLLPVAFSIAVLVVGTAVVLAARHAFGELFVALTLATTLTLLAGPSWYNHYPAFAAAPLSLTIGTGIGVFTRLVASVPVRRAALALVAVTLLAATTLLTLQQAGQRFPGPRLASVLAGRAGCITTDNPITLILSDTLRRNLAQGCPLVVDLSGHLYHLDRDGPGREQRAANRRFQEFAMTYLASGTSAIVIRGWASPENAARIEAWPVVGRAGRVEVRQPVDR